MNTRVTDTPVCESVKTRELRLSSSGQQAMDGDGVKLTRIIGTRALNMLDPFLLLDAFESDRPQDYIGGFPDHPIGDSKPSPTCWRAGCATRTTRVMRGLSSRVACNG